MSQKRLSNSAISQNNLNYSACFEYFDAGIVMEGGWTLKSPSASSSTSVGDLGKPQRSWL